MLAGIGLTISVRYLLIRANLQEELGPRAVIYPSLVALFTFTIWLIFYRD